MKIRFACERISRDTSLSEKWLQIFLQTMKNNSIKLKFSLYTKLVIFIKFFRSDIFAEKYFWRTNMFAEKCFFPKYDVCRSQSIFCRNRCFAERRTFPKVALYLPIYVFGDRIITQILPRGVVHASEHDIIAINCRNIWKLLFFK